MKRKIKMGDVENLLNLICITDSKAYQRGCESIEKNL